MRNRARRRAAAAVLAVTLLAPAAARAQNKLSGIGDSAMQGANARFSYWPLPVGDQIQYSFAQGWDSTVDPLYLRYTLLGLLKWGEEFVSVDGAQMVGGGDNAPAQAQRICDQRRKPDRIIVLLGSNDICNRSSTSAMYDAATFQNALATALDILAKPSCGLKRGTKVHVLSMVPVQYLYAAGIEKELKELIPCQLIWELFDICPIVTRGTDSDRQAVADRVHQYNLAIAAAVAAAQARYAPDIEFTTDWKDAPNACVGTFQFGAAELSDVDCFHPKWSTGQKKLACAAWESWEAVALGAGAGNESGCFSP
jgi:hypothetical protein